MKRWQGGIVSKGNHKEGGDNDMGMETWGQRRKDGDMG